MPSKKNRKENVSLSLEQNCLPIYDARTSYSHRDSFIYLDRIIAMFTGLNMHQLCFRDNLLNSDNNIKHGSHFVEVIYYLPVIKSETK